MRLCAGDIWSTPEYHSLLCGVGATCGPVKEDCDGQTLLGAPFLGGRPLFCMGGAQAHVLTLTEDPSRAVDVSVRAGMPTYQPRQCFWYENGEPVPGHMAGPYRDDRGKMSIFRVRKD